MSETREAELTQQLECAQRLLVQNQKFTLIGQLMQGIAHEMNTPLGVVIANLSVLARYTESLSTVGQAAQTVVPHVSADPLGAALVSPLAEALKTADLEYVLEDAPPLLEESATAARRVADLVRSLSTFARRDATAAQPIDIHEVLEASLNLACNALKHRAQIQRQFTSVPNISGWASELSQVFVHVLLNAAQSLQGNRGSIAISTEQAGEWVVVKVTDTGCGIAREHLEQLFEPFFTTRAPGEGAGMGLTVARDIVQRHGGSMSMASELQHGTTVTVRLPVAQCPGVAA